MAASIRSVNEWSARHIGAGKKLRDDLLLLYGAVLKAIENGSAPEMRGILNEAVEKITK
jgi:hypothetical protein